MAFTVMHWATSFLFLAQAGVKILLVGDSTVNDEGGWGPGFRGAFAESVEVANFAKNGRSSKSFRTEGHWDKGLAGKPDYVLIQFGHNDVLGKGPERETDAATTYKANLRRYVTEAKSAGARPVLVTSIVRRGFTAEGKFRPDSLVPYVAAVREVGTELGVPVMELYELTREQTEKAGPEAAKAIGRIGPDGKQDNTHLGPYGQFSIGRLAALEFVRVAPEMAARLRRP